MQSTLDRISSWMSRQSWYVPGGDGIPRLRELAEVFLPSGEPGSRVRVLVVRDETPVDAVVYQIPLVERDVVPNGSEPGLIGRGYGGAALFDGVSDPAFARSLLAGLREQGRLDDEKDARYVTSSSVLSDEGAVAHIEVQPFGRAPLAVTLYRRVLLGEHPDAAVRETLAEAGLDFMPRLAGTLTAGWTDEDGWPETVHLAVLRETVDGAVDGWTLGVDAARRGALFVRDADRLGASLARTHAALARLQPTRPATAAELESTFDSWSTRLAGAAATIPGIAEHQDGIQRIFDRARELPVWPRLQAVHGSLDLLSTLRSPDGEWSLRDFGGRDPQPALDRADVAAHDVVAVLRSLSYASALADGPDAGWADDARAAFLAGYGSVSGADGLPAELMDALELDLALFDANYETRLRPEHLGIPLATIARLIGAELPLDRATAAA